MITALVLSSCASVSTPAPAEATSPVDTPASVKRQIKASFVYTVTKFVEWPEAADAGPAGPLVIAVLGEEAFVDALRQAVEGKTVHGRSVIVRGAQTLEELKRCDVLYIQSSEIGRWQEVSKALGDSSVLTLGDHEDFARNGGIIHLRLSEQMIRFEVNIDAARRARLSISSRILELGKVVRDRRGGRRESSASIQ